MRGAGRLYAAHFALGALGIGLLGTSAALVIADGVMAPSPGAVSQACQRWLVAGGPADLLGLAIAALTAASLALGVRSVWRQVRASRNYLAALPVETEIARVEGADCRIIDAPEPQAFCAGFLRPRIYLSRGALQTLEGAELQAVLAHETHHLRRRDPLRMLAARVLADALVFIPILRQMSERYAALCELAADEAAVKALRDRGPLASALLKFTYSGPGPTAVVTLAPERVDMLMGDPAADRWRLPRPPVEWSLLALAALGIFVLLLWQGVLSASLQLPVLLAAACMASMIGAPIALALATLIVAKRTLRTRP
jgi:bla regulator protein blaR1